MEKVKCKYCPKELKTQKGIDNHEKKKHPNVMKEIPTFHAGGLVEKKDIIIASRDTVIPQKPKRILHPKSIPSIVIPKTGIV